MTALTVAVPGVTTYLLLVALCLAPFAVLLAFSGHPAYRRLPSVLRTGLPMFSGIAGVMVAVIWLWLISANGVWRSDDALLVRASRVFSAEIALSALRPAEARAQSLATLTAAGRIRAPGYAAGWYRDNAGTRVFVLYAGTELQRIPTTQGFDLALGIVDAQALQPAP